MNGRRNTDEISNLVNTMARPHVLFHYLKICALACFLERQYLPISLDPDKAYRDLMVYFLWQTGRSTNRDDAKLSGLLYSSVSRRISIVRNRLRKDTVFKDKFDRANALIKMKVQSHCAVISCLF